MSTSKIQKASQSYLDRGWRLVRLNAGTKVPKSSAWQNATPGPNDFEPKDNIGIQLGQKSGHLVDIDFDNAWARRLSQLPCFFGEAPSFRRKSLPATEPGHRLVICHDAPDKIEVFGFSTKGEKEAVAPLKLSKLVILEVRAGKGFTVFPPSTLGDDQLVWGDADETSS